MSAPVAPSAPAPAADPWGSPVQAAAQPDAWGAAAAPAANSWGNAPAASTPITSSSDAWTAAAAPSPAANPATDAAGAMAAQYSTIPPGQFATPANAGSAIASSGWGQAAVPPAPLDSAQIEAKKNAWAAEAEQLETGTWKAFAPKMNEGLGGKPAPLPASGPAPAASPAGDRWDVPIQERNKTQIDQPMPTMGAPVAAAPVAPIQPNANAAAGRWDVPIQERPKTDEAIAAPPAVSAPVLGTIGMPPGAVGSPVLSSGIPVNQIVEKMGQVLGGQSSAASAEAQESRWDVPIQERMKNAQVSQEMQPVTAPAASSWGQPAANAAPAAPVEAAPAAPAADANAWGASASSWGQEAAPVAAANSNQAASGWNSQPAAPAASGWGGPATAPQTASGWDAPAAAPAASSWDAPAAAPTASSWDAQPAAAPAASGWDSQPAATPAASGGDAQPAAAPAASSWDAPAAAPAASGWDAQPAAVAAPSNGGWGAGDAVAQPQAQPTSTWGQSAGNSWGDSAAISQQNQVVSQAQSPVGSAAWGAESNNNSWGQPAAPMGNSWASGPQASQPSPSIAPAPPAPPAPHAIPSVKPEVTDKVQGGGLLSGIDDKAIDRIFGEIGVQESVSKGLVNSGAGSGAEPESNFSPPASPAPQEMAATVAPPPQVFSQAAAPEAPKGLLGGIDDNAIDRIFSQNLGVSEPSVPVGAAPAAVANANAAPGNTWQSSVPAPVPTPMATPDVTQNSGWGAPPANTGWGQPPAQTAADLASAPVPPAPAQNSGWGTPPAPGQWGQPAAQAPAAEVMPANGTPKLFSVDDSVMDRIFADNLGIPQDSQPPVSFGQTPVAAPGPAPMPSPAQAAPPEVATPYQAGPPPKIEGIGRLDASADANQDAGSGRIASIGKFLLDQKDLDKIGKLTNVDNNDAGKLRILTKENSDDLQALLGQIGAQKGVIGSVIVGHDGLLIANTMPGDMDAESVGVWALGVYMNTEHVTKKMGHERVHQVVSRTPRGYVIIADFGGGLLVCVTEGKDTDSLIPLMRTITQLVN